jgi:hypothetical protein
LNTRRNADAAWFCNPFQTRCDVHTISKNVADIDDHVADIDADAKLDLLFLGYVRISLRHAALDLDRTAHRIHY